MILSDQLSIKRLSYLWLAAPYDCSLLKCQPQSRIFKACQVPKFFPRYLNFFWSFSFSWLVLEYGSLEKQYIRCQCWLTSLVIDYDWVGFSKLTFSRFHLAFSLSFLRIVLSFSIVASSNTVTWLCPYQPIQCLPNLCSSSSMKSLLFQYYFCLLLQLLTPLTHWAFMTQANLASRNLYLIFNSMTFCQSRLSQSIWKSSGCKFRILAS